MEDSDSRDRICRNKVDHFLNMSPYGKAIEVFVAFLSLISSLAFIVLTYYDLRRLNPCCAEALAAYDEYVENETKARILCVTEVMETLDDHTWL